MGSIRITLLRSLAGRPDDQIATVSALGLRKRHHTVVKENNPAIRGMVQKVRHLVSVEDVGEEVR